MSNWCLGCHRTIPKGDFCPSCRPKDDEEQDRKRDQEHKDAQKKERDETPPTDDIPF